MLSMGCLKVTHRRVFSTSLLPCLQSHFRAEANMRVNWAETHKSMGVHSFLLKSQSHSKPLTNENQKVFNCFALCIVLINVNFLICQ
jgi:hypothetical protein